jgi:hypothetical protein
MASVEQDLDQFTSFARKQITSGRHGLTIDELFDQWRMENPSDEKYTEDVAAVQASLQDFNNGERGTIAGEHSAQLRRKFGCTDK